MGFWVLPWGDGVSLPGVAPAGTGRVRGWLAATLSAGAPDLSFSIEGRLRLQLESDDYTRRGRQPQLGQVSDLSR
jgi:hypothetical protein